MSLPKYLTGPSPALYPCAGFWPLVLGLKNKQAYKLTVHLGTQKIIPPKKLLVEICLPCGAFLCVFFFQDFGSKLLNRSLASIYWELNFLAILVSYIASPMLTHQLLLYIYTLKKVCLISDFLSCSHCGICVDCRVGIGPVIVITNIN